MSDGFVKRSGGGSTYAFVVADWPVGSTCQIARSSDNKTIKAKDTSGHFVFRLPKPKKGSSFDQWTLSCTDGELTSARMRKIDHEGQSEIMKLGYRIDLIKNGQLVEVPKDEETLNQFRLYDARYGSINSVDRTDGKCIKFSSDGKNAIMMYVEVDEIEPYDELVIELASGGWSWKHSAGYIPAFGASDNQPTIDYYNASMTNTGVYETLPGNSSSIPSGLYRLNITDISGKNYIWVSVSGSGTTSGLLYIKNMYLNVNGT